MVLSIAGLASGVYFFGIDRVAGLADGINGIMKSDEPIQKPYSGSEIVMGDFRLTPVATYEITGVVVSTKTYNDEMKVSPIDVCLVWGELTKPEIRNNAGFTQGDRFCNYANLPFKEFYLRSHYSNNHIIPANQSISNAVNNVKVDDKITLKGYLVNVESSSSRWKTSLTRIDTSWGACEIIYVTEVLKGTNG